MSTVQSLLDIIQFRTDNRQPLYPLINLAINMIAKRLYLLDSDIVTAELSQDLWAANTLTAADIVFNNANPDTVTSVGAGFVTAGFESGQQITTTSTTNPGPFKLDTVAAATLTLISTDAVVAAGAASVTITSDHRFAFLPSDFWGLKGKPYFDTYTWYLEPLPSQDMEMALQTAAQPLYYKVKGNNKLYVYPPTASDYTIKGDYFQRPAAISADTDTLPFNELFDDALAEVVLRFYKDGAKQDLNGMQLLKSFLNSEVDLIAKKRQKSAPTPMPYGIDYDRYLT